jgi:hypothetical protein
MKGNIGAIGIIFLLIIGCSSAGNNIPVVPASEDESHAAAIAADEASHRIILAIGTIQIDALDVSGHPCPETPSIAFLPDREAATHWDVAPMLMPPACDDCVKIEVLEFKPGQKYVKLKISLKNPSDLTGYDVRGIAVVPSADVRRVPPTGESASMWVIIVWEKKQHQLRSARPLQSANTLRLTNANPPASRQNPFSRDYHECNRLAF